MFNQAKINRTQVELDSVPVTDHVVNLAADLATLVELQSNLFRLDWVACRSRFYQALLVAGIGAALMIGSLPVFIGGVGWLIAQGADLPVGAVLTLFSSLIILAGVIGLVVATKNLVTAAESFDRSRNELNANLKWIKNAIDHSCTSRR